MFNLRQSLSAILLLLLALAACGQPAPAALTDADPAQSPGEDILGKPRGSSPELGAYELQSTTEVTPTSFLPLLFRRWVAAAAPTPTPTATPTAAPTSTVTPTVGPTPTATPGSGYVTYRLGEQLYRIPARQGAVPENVSAALDSLAPGVEDDFLNLSPAGDWLLLSTDRFHPDCAGWTCLALVSADLSAGEVISAGGSLVRSDGFAAVASGGDLVVYVHGDGSHTRDLWAASRSGGAWSAPIELTTDSPYAWNHQPALSADGGTVVFDCADAPYGQEGTAICEVGSDGSGFRVVLTPAEGPGGSAGNALHHPDYAPDGSIVFEADWDGEQIWRLPAGESTPVRISEQFGNDNSPCLLPDGRIVSLWLGRPDGQGDHEIKVMTADASSYFMLLIDQDVLDIGIGCGE
ncbi:MAG: hypothetical protein JXA37_09215 [Chloroflexia bacterium]|nr:hypothetical protein [Chloroflexia bacterium]